MAKVKLTKDAHQEKITAAKSVTPSQKLLFGKTNYMIMIGGIVLLIVGFFIMTLDKEPHGFGFLGLTLGPLIVALGFATEFFAIFYKEKTTV